MQIMKHKRKIDSGIRGLEKTAVKKTAANCFSKMLSQRELMNYINIFLCIFYLFENSLSRGQFE